MHIKKIDDDNLVKVYGIRIDEALSKGIYHELLKFLSKDRVEKVNKYYFYEDSLRSSFAELLLKYALVSNYGFRIKEIDTYTDDYAKPFLSKTNVHFNLSHSGDWVLCAVAPQPVGIDIAVHRK